MAHPGLSAFRATVWLLLIFTPLSQQAVVRRSSRADAHVRTYHDAAIVFWAQLIAHFGCRDVTLLDSFEFFAHRPAFGRELFSRLSESGHRVSVRRHLGGASQLPSPVHRLAIIVPIVMKTSMLSDSDSDSVRELFKQIGQESYFFEYYNWLFLIAPEQEQQVRLALQGLPIRADSSVYCVTFREVALFRDMAGYLKWKILSEERPVPRMQTIHPEVADRTLVEFALPPMVQCWNESCRSVMRERTVAVQQLYRLKTGTKTIDVSIDLLGTDKAGRMVFYWPRGVEQRNDFFDRAQFTVVVHSCAVRFINTSYVVEHVPLFRNARISIQQSNKHANRKSSNDADLNFRLTRTYYANRKMHALFAFSIPLFYDHLNLYIRYEDIGFGERSTKILEVILVPICSIGVILCLSLLVAFNVMVDGGGTGAGVPKLSVADSIIWFVGIVAQQGSLVRPNSLSTMVLVLVGLSFSSIMYCTYLTRITSQLSVDVEALDYLEDLLETDQYQIGFVGNFTKGQTTIGGNFYPALSEVMERMEEDKTLYSFSHEEGIDRVLKSKYALLGFKGIVRKTIAQLDANEHCEITELSLAEIEQKIALKMRSNYTYRKMINYEILRSYSNGIAARIAMQMIPQMKCFDKTKQFQNITPSHVVMHGWLIAVGTGLSVLTLGAELLFFYSKKIRISANAVD